MVNVIMNDNSPNNLNSNTENQHPRTNIDNKKYFKFPYVEGLSQQIKRTLTNDHSNIVFYHNKKVGNLYSKMKDKLTVENKSNVIYEIPCNCGAVYIGQTKQLVKTRIQEHKYSCNERHINKKEKTALASHHFEFKHDFVFDRTTILDYEHNYKKRLISEMILINKHSNTVNKKTDTENLSRIYNNLISRFVKI